ncbi:MAG: AAA family ATPase, partial [Bacteroidales bacterium]|nr:AAA family ATPase [Bacteroidales bacterium]
MEILDENIKLAYKLIRYTNKSVFLTGKAGTGKTTFLKSLPEITNKRMAVVAPTGVAALNAGGVTIHSFFQLDLAPFIPESANITINKEEDSDANKRKFKMNKRKIKILRSLNLLVIDEISMVRSDVLDAIDSVLRHYRKSSLPFAGVQLLMIGDLYQLSPVIKDEEWQLISRFYKSQYFFDSNALKRVDYVQVELTKIFRQQDDVFVKILNEIRDNCLSSESLEILNSRVLPYDNDDGYIQLSTHNNTANNINTAKLNDIDAKEYHFEAIIKDDFPPLLYPNDKDLVLKVGAQVMFIRNDSSPEKLFYNGKIGTVTEITDEKIFVQCKGDYSPIEVKNEVWENLQYDIDEESGEINQKIIGTFSQIPLRLAWAITIHKSQGLTFEKAIIDVHAAFAFGQVYVALSRCKSLEGLILKTPVSPKMIKSDAEVTTYCQYAKETQPDEQQLSVFIHDYQRDVTINAFSFDELLKHLTEVRSIYLNNIRSFNSTYSKEILDISQQFDEHIYSVNKRFQTELWRIFGKSTDTDLKDNEHLQERVSKAAVYYKGKLNELIKNHFNKMLLESDNKETNADMKDALDKMELEYCKKIAFFDKVAEGYNTETYIKATADAENNFKPSFSTK